MAILSKASKTDNFESHNSLKLSFTNICGLHSNFVDCESSLESNSPGIFALCEKTLRILTYVFDWLYFTQCLTSFSSIDHLLQLCAQFLILFHLTQMRFSRSTHLLMFLFLETLMSIIRTGFPILVELINLVNSSIISNDLTQMVNFPTRIPNCDSHSLALWDLFLSSDTSIPSAMAFPPLEILIMLLSQLPLTFHQLHNRMLHFIAQLMTILVLIGMAFVIT